MIDYRITRYCPEFKEIKKRKQQLKVKIQSKHRVKDLYKLLSPNGNKSYKYDFMRIYNMKCCYCGVQLPIISKELFEIDHFRHKKHPAFVNPAAAGSIDNLVLACRKCNRSKSEIVIDNDDYKKLYPDDGSIAGAFVRKNDYYIEIAPVMQNDKKVIEFYKQLRLNEEVRRLDYLLMNIRGLSKRLKERLKEKESYQEIEPYQEIKNMLDEAYILLQEKRAVMC